MTGNWIYLEKIFSRKLLAEFFDKRRDELRRRVRGDDVDVVLAERVDDHCLRPVHQMARQLEYVQQGDVRVGGERLQTLQRRVHLYQPQKSRRGIRGKRFQKLRLVDQQ